MKKTLIFIMLVLAVLTLSGCSTQTIQEIKNQEHVGKTVAVRGEVTATIKLGPISGYTLTDSNKDTIGVATNDLPKEGSTVTAKGVLMKDTLLGYYIKTD